MSCRFTANDIRAELIETDSPAEKAHLRALLASITPVSESDDEVRC